MCCFLIKSVNKDVGHVHNIITLNLVISEIQIVLFDYYQNNVGGGFTVFMVPRVIPALRGDYRATNENVTQKWIWKPPVAPVNYKSKR